MKNSISYFAATMILFLGFQVSLNAQKTATWKGGTPGRATDWDCSSNWKEGRVPDEFSFVVIPDVSTSTFCYPMISEGVVEIASLQCAQSAKINIGGNAQIVVLDMPTNKPGFKSKELAPSRTQYGNTITARH
ncbi:MAG: hypothetical protein ACKVT2_07820 [Saprospiraceae bacterium]